MSRPINISDSLTFIPSSYENTGSYSFTQGTTANGYTNADSTTNNQLTLAKSNRSARQSQLYFNFDMSALSSIPSGATINSVSSNVKYYVSSTTYVTAVSIRLYSGTTAKGTEITQRPTSATKYSITPGTWTLSELQNARLYVSATHSASNQNAYLYFYGADVTVNYSLSGTEYEVSITNNSETAQSSISTTQYVLQGGSQEISFYNISSLDDVVITDNSNDIESQLVHSTSVSKTDNCIPASLSGSNGTVTDANNGLTDVTSNTYSQLLLRSGTYMEYSFDTSSIPSNATITSISCQVKGCVTRTSNAATAQLYSGSTAKGSTSYLSYNSNVTTINLTCGTWTATELQNARIRIVSTYTNTTNYYAQFYGATLTVNYTVEEDVYTYTISNISADHAIVIEDVAPGFVLTCTDNSTLGDITPTGTQNVEEGDDVVYSLSSSDFSLIKLTDNNVDVTSQIVHSQSSGSGSPVFIPSSYVYSKPTGATGVVIDTIQNGSNAYTNTSSYTYATLLSFEGGSNWAAFYISVSGIPEGAIIDSVTCKVKIRYLLTSSNNSVQLYSGNTAKGTPTSLTYNQTFNDYLNIGTWTAEELQDVRLYICVPGQNQSQGMECAYVYGAELTVTYHSIAGHTYTISNVSAPHTLVLSDQPYYVLTCTDNSTNGDIVPIGTRNVVEGGTAVYTLTSSDFNTIKLKDNGVDVTNQIVYSSTTSSGSPMFVPSGYTNGNPGFTVSDVSNGYKDTSSYASYATLEIPANSTCYGSFIISVSGIPSGAIIDSVSCKVSALKRGNDTVTTYTIQLYSGNTPKGTASSISGSNQVRTVNLETGAWTVEELQDVRLLITGTNKSTNSSFSYLFYGAEFTVTYHSTQGYTYNILNVSAPHTIVLEDSNDRVYIKVNGNFVQVEAVYKKINGVWVEQSDMSSLFDNNHIYVTG